MPAISKLTIEGCKSIRALRDLELRNLNVLIGANGAGKSNFIGFFRVLAEMFGERLQMHVQLRGGPDALLHYGRTTTDRIAAEFEFDQSEALPGESAVHADRYRFELEPRADHQEALSAIQARFETPEHINDSPETAPSKLLARILKPRYRKRLHGPDLTNGIGLDKIREKCPHSRQWFDRISTLEPL
jgi:predicted ATPase